MKSLLTTLFLLLVVTVTEVQAQSFKVIVNEANTISSVSKSELSDIFLKKKTSWNDGTKIDPVDLGARSAVRENFSKEVHGRGVGAIRSYWQQAAFSGAGTAPLERPSDAEVIAFVSANPGAIGYISADSEAPGVKTISIN